VEKNRFPRLPYCVDGFVPSRALVVAEAIYDMIMDVTHTNPPSVYLAASQHIKEIKVQKMARVISGMSPKYWDEFLEAREGEE
jgi:hypothetical protein